ncbi:MAG: NAD(P)H-dependent glycerol-3-phosphate dehydrogenase [Bacillota bacterium]
MRVAIVGAGSWGTALCIPLSDNGHEVKVWARDPQRADEFQRARENVVHLPGVKLPPSVGFTANLDEALNGVGLVVFAVPFRTLREVARLCAQRLAQHRWDRDPVLMTTSKGISTGTAITGTQILAEEFGKEARICCLSGPNFAREVAGRLPSATVVASSKPEVALTVQETLMTGRFRVYVSYDETGVQIGGALKNVFAIAVGMSDGLGLGYNARAGLITRGLAEMTRFGLALGAEARTFSGLSGLGDLVLTCTGEYSRNRQAGLAVARGQSLEEFVRSTGFLVEGVYAVQAVMELSGRLNVEMPICTEVYRILFEGKSPAEGVNALMWRGRKHEHEGITW